MRGVTREQLYEIIKKALSLTGILSLLVSIILLVGQEQFKFILKPLGLYIEQAGVFTDCSKEENRHHTYCQRPESNAEKNWRKTRQKPGFNLSGF